MFLKLHRGPPCEVRRGVVCSRLSYRGRSSPDFATLS